jgi:hypothetical protein
MLGAGHGLTARGMPSRPRRTRTALDRPADEKLSPARPSVPTPAPTFSMGVRVNGVRHA